MKIAYTGAGILLALLGAQAAQADATFCSWSGGCSTRAEAEAAAQQSHGSYASKIDVRMDATRGQWVADVTSKWDGQTSTQPLGKIPYTYTDEDLASATGPEGPQGPQGVPGTAGKDGRDGTDGKDGAAGAKGETGAAGAKGHKGDPGKDGSNGAKGDKGDPGKDGTNGKDGSNGAKGDKGEKGDQGAQGKAGVGVKGDKGDKGDPGRAGQDGSDGSDGAAGVDGRDGATGAAGNNGADGKRGPRGYTGPRGDQGVAGKAADESRVAALEAAAARQRQQTASLQRDVSDLRGGVAGATALGVMQQTPLGRPGELQVSAGVGYYDGETAGALLLGTNFTERLYGNVGAFLGSTGEPGLAGSITYTFRN